MSRVDRIAEKIKLGRLLAMEPAALDALDTLPAGTLRALREQISDSLFDDSRSALERVASASRLLPNALVASVGDRPTVSVEEGVANFVRWYREYNAGPMP